MEYLLKAIKEDLAERVKDIWVMRSSDLNLTEQDFVEHYADMGAWLYRIEKYEFVKEVIKDIEDGVWGVVALDQMCEETMTDWWSIVGREATRLYNQAEL